MPASSPPVSVSSGGSSTSGLGSSASSTSTGANGGVVNGGNANGQQTSSGAGGAGTPSSVGGGGGAGEQLSRTNLYIRGLPQHTTDKDLLTLCGGYGTIISTKAILDKNTNKCKGYGFVDFESPLAADQAVKQLQAQGIQAQMAKVRYPDYVLLAQPPELSAVTTSRLLRLMRALFLPATRPARASTRGHAIHMADVMHAAAISLSRAYNFFSALFSFNFRYGYIVRLGRIEHFFTSASLAHLNLIFTHLACQQPAWAR